MRLILIRSLMEIRRILEYDRGTIGKQIAGRGIRQKNMVALPGAILKKSGDQSN